MQSLNEAVGRASRKVVQQAVQYTNKGQDENNKTLADRRKQIQKLREELEQAEREERESVLPERVNL
ncbi:hypothetical protein N7501_012014 [Penicillium viridicatum]|nr:hypothetical protein N7501_012014 [Penicillium viridicatum]